MDFTDAVNKLVRENPDVSYTQANSMMSSEQESEYVRLKDRKVSRDRYAISVLTAYTRINDWLTSGHQFNVEMTWEGIANFAASHRPACVIAVMICKAREATREAQVFKDLGLL